MLRDKNIEITVTVEIGQYRVWQTQDESVKRTIGLAFLKAPVWLPKVYFVVRSVGERRCCDWLN